MQEDLSLTLGNILEQEDVQFMQQGINFTSSCSKVPPLYRTAPACTGSGPVLLLTAAVFSARQQRKPKW